METVIAFAPPYFFLIVYIFKQENWLLFNTITVHYRRFRNNGIMFICTLYALLVIHLQCIERSSLWYIHFKSGKECPIYKSNPPQLLA